MSVFKTCLTIIKRKSSVLCIYLFVCIFVSIIASQTGTGVSETGFQYTRVNAAIINYDKDGAIAKGLMTQLEDKIELKDVGTEENQLREALLYREVEYILIIPENFTEDFAAGKNSKLDRLEVMGSYSGAFLNSIVDNYLSTVKNYVDSVEKLNIEQIVERINKLFEEKTEISLEGNEKVEDSYPEQGFFKFAIYSILAAVIIGTGLIVSRFNEDNVKKRNMVAPMSVEKLGGQQLMGTLVFGFFIWLILTLAATVICGKSVMRLSGLLFVVNLFIGVVLGLTLGYLICQIFKTENSINAMANTVSLGCSFIGGVFVPMEMMGAGVEKAAIFTPTYWYVKVCDSIVAVNYEDGLKGIGNVFKYMSIELVYAVIIFVIGLVVVRLKKQKY